MSSPFSLLGSSHFDPFLSRSTSPNNLVSAINASWVRVDTSPGGETLEIHRSLSTSKYQYSLTWYAFSSPKFLIVFPQLCLPYLLLVLKYIAS
ncbi:unnamed protein product [Cuscuta epithymum]|uniref:Uncharacterized protein n=1 Tax=Cuscuta epithymum TaxID=186058 RepID=A0AAV0CY90_9ASTE|nr:unnamed protein product [Cuscuta epithymum]